MTTWPFGLRRIPVGRGSSNVEAYRLDRYDNCCVFNLIKLVDVVEAYRLDRYDNFNVLIATPLNLCCRSLSFG